MKKEEAGGDFCGKIRDHWRVARVLGGCGAGADLPGDLCEAAEAMHVFKSWCDLGTQFSDGIRSAGAMVGL